MSANVDMPQPLAFDTTLANQYFFQAVVVAVAGS